MRVAGGAGGPLARWVRDPCLLGKEVAVAGGDNTRGDGVTTGVTFRRYQEADYEGVWSVFASTTAQLGFETGPWDDDMHNIPAVYLQPGGEFIVGGVDGRIVAIAAYRRELDGRASVHRVAVHPDVQRRGIGRTLVVELEDRARRAGITVLHLDTSIGQVAAQRLYTSCGYREVGHIVQSGVECVLYEKNVA